MPVRRLGNLTPGMVLIKPVHDMHGVLLLTLDTVLTGSNLRMLKSWGVTEVWVEGETENEGEGPNRAEAEINRALQKRLAEKFSGVVDNPVMAEIMRVAQQRLLERHLRKKQA